MADEIDRRFNRLEEDARERERRLRKVEIVLARFPDLEDDIKNTRTDCQAIRTWVEKRDEKKEALTAGQRAAITAGMFALAVALLALLGTMISAGVFK